MARGLPPPGRARGTSGRDRDGRMAFIKSPDGISIEVLQIGEALPQEEPWKSMPNTGTW